MHSPFHPFPPRSTPRAARTRTNIPKRRPNPRRTKGESVGQAPIGQRCYVPSPRNGEGTAWNAWKVDSLGRNGRGRGAGCGRVSRGIGNGLDGWDGKGGGYWKGKGAAAMAISFYGDPSPNLAILACRSARDDTQSQVCSSALRRVGCRCNPNYDGMNARVGQPRPTLHELDKLIATTNTKY